MGRAYLNVRATGWERLHPYPWKGEGPWVGVEKSCKPNAMEFTPIAEVQPIITA